MRDRSIPPLNGDMQRTAGESKLGVHGQHSQGARRAKIMNDGQKPPNHPGEMVNQKRRSKRTSTFWLLCLLPLMTGLESANGNEPPAVAVTNVRRVFDNGEHNAFTDMIRFRDRFYLTFRSCPDGHGVHPTSSIIILESRDRREWKQVHRFRVPKRDVRDPHFLIFKDRLFVYTGAWYCGDSSPKTYEYNTHLGFACFSDDGRKWSEPTMLEGTFGHYIWRAAAHDGVAYLCARRKHLFAETPRSMRSDVESAMLESDDGLIWRKRALFQPTMGNETAFVFEPNGEVVAVSRYSNDNSQLSRSQPPYTKWRRTDLDRYIGGPMLAKWGDRYLVGGRKNTGPRPTTTLYWLIDGELKEVAELPSGGDNSYPGFVPLDSNRGLVSWYSSHERDANGKTITAIYLADLTIKE